MEPIKIKVFRHSDLPEIFGYNPLPLPLLYDYLKPRPGILENVDIFFENIRTKNKNFKSNLFVESKDENFDIVVFGTYLELFEYHGLFSIIEESIMKMSEKYSDKIIIFYWNHDNDFKKYNEVTKKYSNVRILNFNTSEKTENDIILPFWSTLDNFESKNNKKYYCSFIGTINNSLRSNLLTSIKDKFEYNYFSNLNFDDYRLKLSQSYFSLSPRGHGLSSYRFFESIYFNTIPVLFADDIKLPYTEIIDYTKISIKIDEVDAGDFKKIDSKLKSVNVKDMLLNINTYKNMFTLGGIQEYLYNKLR
jgi:hypothetical protein